jgi:hypothetical protein
MDREPQQLAADDSEVSDLGPRLSPRARLRRLAISVAAVLLALLVVVASLPALRQDALTLLIAPTPTPTLRSLPGADTFYFLATPPWVTVLVDGRPLDPVPVVEEQPAPVPPVSAYGFDTPTPTRGLVPNAHSAPVKLARGVHTLEWRGAPFLPQRCTLPVPVPLLYDPRGNAGCVFAPYPGSPPGYLVQRRESLATVPLEQRSALRAAIADGLTAARASAGIQPGEPYLAPGPPPAGSRIVYVDYRIVYADAPLRATLRFTPDTTSTWPDPCAVPGGLFQPCWFPGQDCRQLCTAPQALAPLVSGTDRVAWMVGAPLQAAWQLTMAHGLASAPDLPGPGPVASLALLRVTWDGTSWHVTPLFGHAAGAPVTDDAICAPARDWLTSTSTIRSPVQGPLVPPTRLDVGIAYVSGPDPTDGCFVSVDPSSFAVAPVPPIVPPATFLLRFGVLLAVNAAARQLAPQLPVADAYEQAIARRLQAQATGGG